MSKIEQVTASFVAGAQMLASQTVQARASREYALARLDALGATPDMLAALADLIQTGMSPSEVRSLARIYQLCGLEPTA